MSKARELANLGNAYSDGALSNRNWLINGDFSVWQRGTSHTTGGYGSVDRWSQHFNGSQTLTRITMNQTRANEIKAACGHVPNYFVSYNVTSFGTYSGFRTRIEDIMKASGQTVTFSVVAASENGSVLQPALRIWNTSAGASQDIPANAVTTNSVMNRYEFTVTFADVFTVGATPDGTGFIEVELYTDRVGWHDYACFQLEVGDTATPFEHRSYGQELALCQRYYQLSLPASGKGNFDGTLGGWIVPFSPKMRSLPSVTLRSLTYHVDEYWATARVISGISYLYGYEETGHGVGVVAAVPCNVFAQLGLESGAFAFDAEL